MSKDNVKKIILFFYIILVLFLICNIYLDRFVSIDESYSYFHAKRSIEASDEMGYTLLSPIDTHPPAYYMVLHYWMKLFGESTQAIRALSMLFGIGCFFLLYAIIDYKFKLKKKIKFLFISIFFALFVLSTTNIYYFTEARMYAMGLFFCLLSFYSLMKIHKGDKYFWMFMFSIAIAIFTHYYAIFFIAGEFVYFCLFYRMPDRKKAFLIWIMPALFILMAGIFLLKQRLRIAGYFFQTSSWSSMLSTYFYAFFHSNSGTVSNINTMLGYIFLIVCFGLIIFYLKNVEKKEQKFSAFLLLWYLCSVLIGMALSIFITKAYHHRFFFFEGWILMLLLARSISFLFEKRTGARRIVLTLAIIFIAVVYVSNGTDYFSTQPIELRDVASEISYYCQYTCLPIIHESPFSMLPFRYYLGDGNFLYTELTESMLHSAAGDAIPGRLIFRDKNQLYDLNEFFYVSSAGTLRMSGFNYTLLMERDGLRLYYVKRFNSPPIITKVAIW